jgi:hypothetical protein
MKKKLITLSILIICIWYQPARAAETCLIEDSPAPALLEYIQNNRKVVQNITKQVSAQAAKREKTNIINDGRNIARLFNKLISWDGYFSYFDYYIIFPLSNDVAYEVKRDHRMLEGEETWLNKYLKSITKNWYSDISITKDQVCAWVNNCKITTGSADDIMGKLIKNNSKVLDLYRKAVMSQNIDFNASSLILVEKNFKEEIEKYYSGNKCPTYLENIKKRISEIQYVTSGSEKAAKRWIDAWNLLTWVDSDQEIELERKLLAQELQRQWVSTSATESALKNLNKYNKWWGYSLENNFITNSFNHLKDSITRELERFNEDVLIDSDAKEQGQETEQNSINNLLQSDKKHNINLNIAKRISELYNSEIPFAAISETNTDKLKSRIINLHNNLNSSINTLSTICEYSVKVCTDQDKGSWTCGKCD